MGATLLEEDDEEEEGDDEEEPAVSKKLSKEDLEIDVKEDIDAIVSGEELSEDFKTKAATILKQLYQQKLFLRSMRDYKFLKMNTKKNFLKLKMNI